MPPKEKPASYTIDGREWYITRDDDGMIRDISIQIKDKEDYNAIQQRLAHPNVNFSNTKPVDIFRNALAQARVAAVSESEDHLKTSNIIAFIDKFHKQLLSPELTALNDAVNHRCKDPQKQLITLSNQLIIYEKSLTAIDHSEWS